MIKATRSKRTPIFFLCYRLSRLLFALVPTIVIIIIIIVVVVEIREKENGRDGRETDELKSAVDNDPVLQTELGIKSLTNVKHSIEQEDVLEACRTVGYVVGSDCQVSVKVYSESRRDGGHGSGEIAAVTTVSFPHHTLNSTPLPTQC
jgi:hypothetical protein